MTALKDDKIFIPLDEVFDLSKITYPVTSEVDKGKVLTYDQPFASKHFAKYNFKNLNYVKTLTPHMVAFMYDNAKLIIQNLTLNSKSFEDVQYYDLTALGVTVFCSDIVINPLRPVIYIGCFPSTGEKDRQLRIHTIDYVQKSEYKVTYV
jgi:hypothetical protein